MKVTETNFRKPSFNKVTIAKLNHYDKVITKKDFAYTTISHW